MSIQFWGAMAFGAVIGWTTYFILRRAQPKTLGDITTFVGAIGGAAVTGLFEPKGDVFAGYAIGLFIGFALFFIVYLAIIGKKDFKEKLLSDTSGGAMMVMMNQGGGLENLDKSIPKKLKE
jgi:hypothetical protein